MISSSHLSEKHDFLFCMIFFPQNKVLGIFLAHVNNKAIICIFYLFFGKSVKEVSLALPWQRFPLIFSLFMLK